MMVMMLAVAGVDDDTLLRQGIKGSKSSDESDDDSATTLTG